MGMLSLECPASPFLLEESSRLAPFLEPEAAGAGFRRKCLVFNVHASDARLNVFPHRVIRIDGVAVARVRVREDRDLHGQDNFPGIVHHVAHAGPGVGPARLVRIRFARTPVSTPRVRIIARDAQQFHQGFALEKHCVFGASRPGRGTHHVPACRPLSSRAGPAVRRHWSAREGTHGPDHGYRTVSRNGDGLLATPGRAGAGAGGRAMARGKAIQPFYVTHRPKVSQRSATGRGDQHRSEGSPSSGSGV
jgi:hypothetical protein